MRIRVSPVVLALLLCTSGAASAQVPDWVTVLLNAAQLPVSANAARSEGVPGNEVRAVIEALRGKNVRAGEARDVLDEARAARREHGPVDNFGAFVQSKLDAGLRGRALAAAIRAEHAARGKGAAGASKSSGRMKGKSPSASDAKSKSAPARGDSGKAARPNPAGKGKRPTDNR